MKPASQPDVDSPDGNETNEVNSGGDLDGDDESLNDNKGKMVSLVVVISV